MTTILRPIVFGLAALVAVLMAAPVSAQQAADTIYFGGDILTMESKAPRYVEALAVKDGRITFKPERFPTQVAGRGRTHTRSTSPVKHSLPGFVDGHSHIFLHVEGQGLGPISHLLL